MAEGVVSGFRSFVSSVFQVIPDVIAQGWNALASVGDSPIFSRKRRAPDSDDDSTSVPSLSEEQEPGAPSETPAIQPGSHSIFADTVAARQNVYPSGFRRSKRPRYSLASRQSPAWSSSPAYHTAILTPGRIPAVRTRASSWRDSLPPRTPRFSADSSVPFRPESTTLFPRTPSSSRAVHPSVLLSPSLGTLTPRISTPQPRRAVGRGRHDTLINRLEPGSSQSNYYRVNDTALSRLVQESHTDDYLRHYRHRVHVRRDQRPESDTLRISGGRVKKPDRGKGVRGTAAKAAHSTKDEDNARTSHRSAWPPRFPKLPRPTPDSTRTPANGLRLANGTPGRAHLITRSRLRSTESPAPGFPASALNAAPAIRDVAGLSGKAVKPALSSTPSLPAPQVAPPVSAAQVAPSASRPVHPPKLRPPTHAISEQQQSDVDSNLPLCPAEKSLDLVERAGISRDELCKIYTPGLVEMMEKNPLFAQKLLKKHGADMATELMYPARRHERKWRITAAEEDLVKIRSHSRLYSSVQYHSDAIYTSALKATANTFATAVQSAAGGSAEKPPPYEAPHWKLVYWASNDQQWEEGEASLSEKEAGITVVNENSAFSPLTQTAIKRLRKAMTDPNVNQQLNKIDGCIIHGSDLRLLMPNTWLNDEIVNSYMHLLFKRSERVAEETIGSKYAKIRVTTSFFYSKLFAENRALGRMEYDYSRVRRWTRRFDVFAYDIFIVPINVHNMHWTLGVVNFKDKRVEHYDSFGGSGSGEILTNLMKWVRDEMESKKGETLDESEWAKVAMTARLPQQNNSDDCGVFICKFADFVSRQAEITFRAEHMRYFRARIAHEILVGRVA